MPGLSPPCREITVCPEFRLAGESLAIRRYAGRLASAMASSEALKGGDRPGRLRPSGARMATGGPWRAFGGVGCCVGLCGPGLAFLAASGRLERRLQQPGVELFRQASEPSAPYASPLPSQSYDGETGSKDLGSRAQ
jgi:hypothetical protein